MVKVDVVRELCKWFLHQLGVHSRLSAMRDLVGGTTPVLVSLGVIARLPTLGFDTGIYLLSPQIGVYARL